MGFAFDRLVEAGGTAIFEETGELIGCEHLMAERAINGAIGESLIETVEKAKRYYQLMGYSSFSAGNAEGGLTTIEEKSLGAYSKSGTSKIRGIIKPCELPPAGGLYLLDVVPDGLPKFGRSEEHTSELQSLMRISYAVFCLKKKKDKSKYHKRH